MNDRDMLLLDDWRHGRISDQDFAALQERLYGDSELRAALRALADLEEGLSGLAARPSEGTEFFEHQPKRNPLFRLAAAAAVVIGLGMGAWMLRKETTPDSLSASQNNLHYDERERPIQTVATWKDGLITPTTISLAQENAQLKSASGAEVHVEGPALFGIESSSGGILYKGSVRARLEEPDSSYSVQVSNLRIVDRGTEFRVTIVNDKLVEVEVLDGEIEVQTLNRQPVFYWDFETNLRDRVGGLELVPAESIRQVEGLVGEGALAFDNSSAANTRIKGGTGEKVGTGTLAFSSGISIEALFVSHWTAQHKDYDTIFRKEDGRHRVLLSFQNDGDVGDYDLPEVKPGPMLSFGLHLDGHGYSELDMPLDGRDSRPSVAELTDGKVHHVVATYDSFTGEKVLFIDGRRCFTHRFPIGTLILSGGPARAQIGNYDRKEPFNGTIDEVALYAFALTAEEVAEHYQNANRGERYFNTNEKALDAVRWKTGKRYAVGRKLYFDRHTGLPGRFPKQHPS